MKKLLAYCNKYYDILSYIFFGVLTTGVNFLVYILFARVFLIHIIVSNGIAWLAAVVFAFVSNRKYVFKSEANTFIAIFKEFALFVLCRIVSGFLDTAILYTMVNYMLMNDLVVKIIAGVVVIVFNYIASKLFIFKKTSS